MDGEFICCFLQITNCPGKGLNFNLSFFPGVAFSSASSDFREARYLVAESLSLGLTLSVVSCSTKIARKKGKENLRSVQNIIQALLDFKRINGLLTIFLSALFGQSIF
jgi:hypothetical protein